MKTKSLILAAALTGITLAGAGGCSSSAPDAKGECHGVNGCKGKGDCSGKGHGCAGQNTCKGKGWLKTTPQECADKAGTFKAT